MIPKSPKIIFLTGGLGNQLFQFTYGRWLASEFGFRVKFANLQKSQIHSSSALRLHNDELVRIPASLEEAAFKLAHRISLAIQKDLLVNARSTALSRAMLIQAGYWQTPFFLDNWSSPSEIKMRQIFEAMGVVGEITTSQEVVVHIRRGDYRPRSQEFGLLSPSYYKNALETLGVSRSDPVSVISDEPIFAQDLIRGIGWEGAFCPSENNLKPAEVLTYAASAKKLIVSNSTFGWWAASLGSPDKAVAAPETWFRSTAVSPELLRSGWRKIPSDWSERGE